LDAHRIRRLAETLITSQVRSGRNGPDPASWSGRPSSLAVYNIVAFLLGLAGAFLFLPAFQSGPASLAADADAAAPLVPFAGVALVLVAGVMFELMTTAKFSGSDAANWLPITPTEYVAASASAIAFTYSWPIALLLGALLPVALGGGVLGIYLLTAGLSVLALLEGALLIEMIRAATQQTGSASTGRWGAIATLVRAGLLVVLLLAVYLLLNPTYALAILHSVPAVESLSYPIPLFWSTQAIGQWVAGHAAYAIAFALGQLAFVGLLLYLAGVLRDRYWVPSPTDATAVGSAPSSGHRFLRALGLSEPEAAIASKDLRGSVRRRELLPPLVVPAVLLLLLLVEGSTFGRFGALLWAGWVAGFFALLQAARSIGQERHSLQWLYAYPISVRSILRAKFASVLLPSLIAGALTAIVAAWVARLSGLAFLGALLLFLAGASVLALWGLVFAARFSDFQDRPRPQFIRLTPMYAAMGSGMVLLFAIVGPGTYALVYPSWASVVLGAGAAGSALVAIGLAYHWASTGFEELFHELPF